MIVYRVAFGQGLEWNGFYLVFYWILPTYTPGWNVRGEWFLDGNHGNHKNFYLCLISKNFWLILMELKQKSFFFFFWKIKFKMADLKKSAFFKIANSKYFFLKISWIGPWVSRIEWCERHWCGLTYMAVRLSDISSKTGKKCIFWVFRLSVSLCWTASRPYRLSHMNALRIIQSY